MNIRSDLAMEAAQSIQNKEALKGVVQAVEEKDGFTLTRVSITTKEAAQALGKSCGDYITLEHPDLCFCDEETLEICQKLLAEVLTPLLPQGDCVLVVGLGNARITPDALGPAAAEKIFVTRHLINTLGIKQIDGVPLQSVCSISPGVLGVTGLETALVIEGLCKKLQPCCVICIDSLASMSTSRLLSTVQVASSGIAPGSGVGNHTHALNEETLGIPVLAVGVPTVLYASTIVRDASGREHLALSMEEDMLVTPRNIDEANDILSTVIAGGINRALQKDLSPIHMQ